MTVPTVVDCVVVSYNSAVDLPACIDSLTGQEGVSVRVVVVDNLSSDDSVETARQWDCAVVVNGSNRGFAAAVNQGLRQGCTPWVLVLNPDARLAPGALGGRLCTSRPRRSCTLVGDRRGIVGSGRSCTTTSGRLASIGGQPAGGTG